MALIRITSGIKIWVRCFPVA